MRLRPLVILCGCAAGFSCLFGHGAAEAVIGRLTRELEKQPADAALYLRRAQAHLDRGDGAACMADADQAERLQPGNAGAALLRGRALLQMQRPEAALAALDPAVAAHPGHSALQREAARAAEACGRLEEALAHQRGALRQAVRPEPDHLLTEVRLLCALHREAEALEVLDAGGRAPALVGCAIEIEVSLHRYDAALSRIDAMISAEPASLHWSARRASVLAQAGRLEASLQGWRALRQKIHSLPSELRSSPPMITLLQQSKAAISALDAVTIAGNP